MFFDKFYGPVPAAFFRDPLALDGLIINLRSVLRDYVAKQQASQENEKACLCHVAIADHTKAFDSVAITVRVTAAAAF